MAIVDFTNPGACRWYADKLRALCDMGVDAFKTDFGERIPTDVQWLDVYKRQLRACSSAPARACPAS